MKETKNLPLDFLGLNFDHKQEEHIGAADAHSKKRLAVAYPR